MLKKKIHVVLLKYTNLANFEGLFQTSLFELVPNHALHKVRSKIENDLLKTNSVIFLSLCYSLVGSPAGI